KHKNFNFLNNVRVKEDIHTHNVVHNLKLVERLTDSKFEEIPALNFPLTDEDQLFADNYISKMNLNKPARLIGLHAGCSTLKNHIHRRWSPESFSGLSKKLLQDKNNKVLIFGGPEEAELKEKISNSVNSDNFIDVQTGSLSQTAALIKKTDLFITNDSGLMHIAAAMQRKIISLIGPTNSDFISPWKTEFKIASLNLECAPCFFYSPKPLSCSRTDKQFKCLKELSVEQVYQLAEELI
ncbi:MAG: glycosyltransferase family 9 protein, partial [Rhodothermaceae bacterium]